MIKQMDMKKWLQKPFKNLENVDPKLLNIV